MPATRAAHSTRADAAAAKPIAGHASRKKAAAKAPPPKAGRLAAVTAKVVTSRRDDAKALVGAGRQSAAGVKIVLQRCQSVLRETLSELRSVARLMQHVGARESVAQLDRLAVALLMLSISSVRELAALA